MYTPKKFMSDVDTFYMGVQVTKDGVASGASDLDASNATPVMTSKVEVMPANIMRITSLIVEQMKILILRAGLFIQEM